MLWSKIIGAGRVGGGVSYWLGLLGGAGNNDIFYGVATDASGQVTAVGVTNSDGAGGNDSLVTKYSASGTLLWARTLGVASNNDSFYGVASDSLGNTIAVGVSDFNNAPNYGATVVKYDALGNLLWARYLGGTLVNFFYGVAIDSADNIIAVGYTTADGAGGQDALIAKYTSSGTLLWDRTLGGTTADQFNGVAVDSADNIIAAGYTQFGGGTDYSGILSKYSADGVISWTKKLGGASFDGFFGVALDSADNIIAVGVTQSDGAGSGDGLVAKYNSSGTLLWDKTLGGASYEVFNSVAVDASDNIVAVGRVDSDGAGGQDGLIAKYDASGTLLWDKTIGGPATDLLRGVSVDLAGDAIVVVGQTASDGAGGTDCLIAKLPTDGAGNGTYGGNVYQDAVLTDAAAVLTNSTVFPTDAPAVLTDAAAVLTDAPAILTEELFEIPA